MSTPNSYGGTRAARNRRAQKKPNSPNHSNTDMNKFLGKARRIRARLARGLEMAAARTKIVRYINARTPGHCDKESPAALPTSEGLESMTIQSVVFCAGNHPVIFVPGRGQPAFAPYTCTSSLLLRLVRCDRQVLALFRTLESGLVSFSGWVRNWKDQ